MTGRSCWCLELFRKRPADGAQHRRRRVQPPRAGRRVAGGRIDRRAALPCQRAALCRRSAARRDEPRDARLAAPDPPGARSADDDCGSGRRRRSSGRGSPSSRSSTRAPTSAPASPATSTTRSRRTSPPSACTSRPVCRSLGPRHRRPARADDGARRRPPGARRGAALDQPASDRPRSRIARSPRRLAALARQFTAETGVRVQRGHCRTRVRCRAETSNPNCFASPAKR